MVNRSMLLGFGAGLVFAAGFMLVFPSPAATPPTLTKEQLQAAAEASNMILVPKQEYEGKPATPPAAPAQPTPPSAQKPTAGAPAQPQTTAVPAVPTQYVEFRIIPGTNSAEVALQLVKAGILPKENQFVEKLRDQKKLNRIRSGTYRIPKGISVDELIRLLTTPPKKE
jgi:hypothetical protein